MYGHPDVLRTLVGAGADVNVLDKRGRSALALAATTGHVELVQELCSAGASASISDANGWSPLMFAAAGGHASITDQILHIHVITASNVIV